METTTRTSAEVAGRNCSFKLTRGDVFAEVSFPGSRENNSGDFLDELDIFSFETSLELHDPLLDERRVPKVCRCIFTRR